MDAVFVANENERTAFLRCLLRACGGAYICLWLYWPQPHRRVPGLAFKKNLPYLELAEPDLIRLASAETQLQFYQGAGIKTGVFMACKSGEIELGVRSAAQVGLETEMKSWFPDDFSRHPPTVEQSSSSSLRSVSLDSPDHSSSLIFKINSPSHIHWPVSATPPATLLRFLEPDAAAPAPAAADAMTRAMLAVISSSSRRPSAFHRYEGRQGVKRAAPNAGAAGQASVLERAVAYFKRLYALQETTRRQAQTAMPASRPSTTQVHHMISERRRREKLNENFQALKSLLPPGSKKDKASVLANARDYLRSLQAQVSDLSRRNQRLEAQVLPTGPASRPAEAAGISVGEGSAPPAEGARPDIRIENVVQLTAEERRFSLRVIVTSREGSRLLDLTARLLEFLRRLPHLSMESMEADSARLPGSPASHRNALVMTLTVQGDEWEESGFLEALERLVGDLAR